MTDVNVEDLRTRRSTVLSKSAAVVRTPKAAEVIADRLRSRIVRGEIAAGEMLPSEKLLMVEFAVSRPTLREAFRILESEGLLKVLTGARGGPQAQLPGLSVAARHIGLYLQVQGTTLEDLLEARTAFEPLCARFLALRCSVDGLAAMRACAGELASMLDHGLDDVADFTAWVELTAEFHDLIANHCGNKTLGAQAHALREVAQAHRRMGIRQRVDRGDNLDAHTFAPLTVDAYVQLVDLVEARDADGAELHWRRHLETAASIIFESRDRSTPISLFD